ncbi:peptidoglycan DD-metalloendopeptidase family protein [bacterium]|nr:peptidoglycan DD-metalloendopeptidase family protein [bacterium]
MSESENRVTKLFSKQFCLWLVPAGSGSVKKLRFSARRAFSIVALVVVLCFGVVFVAGDYVRVQLARVQDALSYADLQARHEKLSTEANELSRHVQQLRRERTSLEDTQFAVQSRVLELHALLNEMKSIGLLSDFDIPERDTAMGSSEETVSVERAIGEGEVDGAHQHSEVEDFEDKDLVGESGIGGLEDPIALEDGRLELRTPFFRLGHEKRSLSEELDRLITRLRKLPIGFPGNGHINSHFGPRRSPFTRRTRMHQGVDMALPYGSYIAATADGVVEAVRRTGSYGLMIDVRHANGVTTRFAHLSKALVREDEEVCRGEYLGLVGNSGRSTGPHLHYEVRVNGKPINPRPLMMIPSRVTFGSLLK